jgi:pimeloyl-ACP methyl ester carboxylesterase
LSVLVNELATRGAAVLTFNNRGFERVSKMRIAGKRKWILSGAAFERFADCVDDINGAIRYVKARGARTVHLLGHSTGCQKSVYWAARGGRGARSITLLAPISDYSTVKRAHGAARYERVLKMARLLIARGKGNALLPLDAWPTLDSAQRFVSLYTPDSPEEIFTYSQASRVPKTLMKVRVPLFVVLAEKDEYADRPAKKIADWFIEHIYEGEVAVMPRVGHSFKGAEERVARLIRRFVQSYM